MLGCPLRGLFRTGSPVEHPNIIQSHHSQQPPITLQCFCPIKVRFEVAQDPGVMILIVPLEASFRLASPPAFEGATTPGFSMFNIFQHCLLKKQFTNQVWARHCRDLCSVGKCCGDHWSTATCDGQRQRSAGTSSAVTKSFWEPDGTATMQFSKPLPSHTVSVLNLMSPTSFSWKKMVLFQELDFKTLLWKQELHRSWGPTNGRWDEFNCPSCPHTIEHHRTIGTPEISQLKKWKEMESCSTRKRPWIPWASCHPPCRRCGESWPLPVKWVESINCCKGVMLGTTYSCECTKMENRHD